ncbi:hypothetical protein ASE73_02585 [Sphingomonas sp. Leaf24]|uniref:hypothetical protein n=1 Tax=unclassified Sphingomonas TaxID=196159 RepID=UPI0006F9E51F|nr:MULTISPECIES: hypothetical protein [unclassified Sphingomonas]KQM23130.1 hypothetical protein ASE50_02585 [Sphingomonas sp. Leaf5]KQM95988.1 hypothetical protein ASE73_02585 [Sphingomonas sp. Leaf24]
MTPLSWWLIHALAALLFLWGGGAVAWFGAERLQPRRTIVGVYVWRALFWPRFIRWRGRHE